MFLWDYLYNFLQYGYTFLVHCIPIGHDVIYRFSHLKPSQTLKVT